MYKKVSVESLPLTPELARQFAEMIPLPGERSLKAARRAYLEVQLLRGKFDGPDWADGRCKQTGITYRLDGQHSSDLLVHLPEGAHFPADLLATITHYEFDNMGDAVDVFNLFNHPKSVRGNPDMMGTYAAMVNELAEYSREFLVDVGNGLFEYERRRKLAKEKDTLVLGPRERGLYFMWPNRPEFLPLTHWLATFRDQMNGKFLHRGVIVADMLVHRVANPELADTFWRLVFSETHNDPTHETRALAAWYREQLSAAAKPKLDMGAFRKRATKAWKTFRVNEAIGV